MAEKNDYKDTLNLPRTEFPMKAGLLNLRSIYLEKCPVTDLSPLDHLPKLEKVNCREYRPDRPDHE